jgi:ACR3 family arsenite efflux pump ArsB
MGELMDSLVNITGNILVFCLVFGMSATVDTKCFRAQVQNSKAIITGVLLQFLLMPFLGFLLVKTLALDYITGLMLLVVTCSPGGSYSNWWCSLFNADLALSVTMVCICASKYLQLFDCSVMLNSHTCDSEDCNFYCHECCNAALQSLCLHSIVLRI